MDAPTCECHGLKMRRTTSRGHSYWRCSISMNNYTRRARVKLKAIIEAEAQKRGNKCQECGLENFKIVRADGREVSFLEWHHANGAKDFDISTNTVSQSALRAELAKCLLLCPNCHKVAGGEVLERG